MAPFADDNIRKIKISLKEADVQPKITVVDNMTFVLFTGYKDIRAKVMGI